MVLASHLIIYLFDTIYLLERQWKEIFNPLVYSPSSQKWPRRSQEPGLVSGNPNTRGQGGQCPLLRSQVRQKVTGSDGGGATGMPLVPLDPSPRVQESPGSGCRLCNGVEKFAFLDHSMFHSSTALVVSVL